MANSVSEGLSLCSSLGYRPTHFEGRRMAEDRPDRIGWVSGPLLDLPREDPFPAFTEFEIQALSAIARKFGGDEFKFHQQISHANVIDGANTSVGFILAYKWIKGYAARLPSGNKGGCSVPRASRMVSVLSFGELKDTWKQSKGIPWKATRLLAEDF